MASRRPQPSRRRRARPPSGKRSAEPASGRGFWESRPPAAPSVPTSPIGGKSNIRGVGGRRGRTPDARLGSTSCVVDRVWDLRPRRSRRNHLGLEGDRPDPTRRASSAPARCRYPRAARSREQGEPGPARAAEELQVDLDARDPACRGQGGCLRLIRWAARMPRQPAFVTSSRSRSR